MKSEYIGLLVVLSSFVIGMSSMYVLVNMVAGNPVTESPLTSLGPQELFSPADTISEDQIKVYKNGVYVRLQDGADEWLVNLDLRDPTWSTFTDTNSMDPVIDQGANTVRIKVPCDKLQVGDIVSYARGDAIIIHRIVHQDVDEEGVYFVLKGDNNPASDPGKVRCEQVLGKVVAIFY